MAGVSTVLPSPVAPKDRMSKTVFELGSLVAFARPANPLRATPAKPVPAVFRNPRRGLLSDRMAVRVRASLPGLKPTLLCDHIGTAEAVPWHESVRDQVSATLAFNRGLDLGLNIS